MTTSTTVHYHLDGFYAHPGTTCRGCATVADKPLRTTNVEVRPNDDGTIDEVLIYQDGRCLFHMEQMGDDAYWFAIYPPDTEDRWSFWMQRKGKLIRLLEEERP